MSILLVEKEESIDLKKIFKVLRNWELVVSDNEYYVQYSFRKRINDIYISFINFDIYRRYVEGVGLSEVDAYIINNISTNGGVLVGYGWVPEVQLHLILNVNDFNSENNQLILEKNNYKRMLAAYLKNISGLFSVIRVIEFHHKYKDLTLESIVRSLI